MSLEGGWTVESLAVGGELVPPLPGGKPLRIDIVDGRVSGSTGVNRFMGEIGGDKPFPSPVATTMMAGPEDLMAQESILLGHIESVDSVEHAGEGILLLADGLVLLTLIPAGTD